MNLAIFGGTFDPIHSGHIEAVISVADAFAIDKVLVIPSGNPPHKARTDQAEYEHRYRMVELACSADLRLTPSRLEQPSADGQRHYSYDTIQNVRRDFEFDEPLRFIIGGDAFAEIHLWHRWQEVVGEVEFLVVDRPGCSVDEAALPAAVKAQRHSGPLHPASSSEIRHRAKMGGTLADMAPATVCDYIWEHRLYQLY